MRQSEVDDAPANQPTKSGSPHQHLNTPLQQPCCQALSHALSFAHSPSYPPHTPWHLSTPSLFPPTMRAFHCQTRTPLIHFICRAPSATGHPNIDAHPTYDTHRHLQACQAPSANQSEPVHDGHSFYELRLTQKSYGPPTHQQFPSPRPRQPSPPAVT